MYRSYFFSMTMMVSFISPINSALNTIKYKQKTVLFTFENATAAPITLQFNDQAMRKNSVFILQPGQSHNMSDYFSYVTINDKNFIMNSAKQFFVSGSYKITKKNEDFCLELI